MIAMQYIKKEDVEYFANQRNKMLGITYICFAIAFWFIYATVLPKMTSLFTNLGKPSPYPFVPLFMGLVVGLSLLASLYYLVKKVDKKALQQKLKKYKSGEMIRANHAIDMTDTYLTLGYFAVVLVIFIAVVILPIYDLSNSL